MSARYYREELRLVRWLGGGAFVVLAGVLAESIAFGGTESSLIPDYGAITVLEGLLFSIAFLYARPGPVEAKVSERGIVFRWVGGRTRVLDPAKPKFGARLTRRLSVPKLSRLARNYTVLEFLIRGRTRVALTASAFDAILQELERRGLAREVKERGDPAQGVWRVFEFSAAPRRP